MTIKILNLHAGIGGNRKGWIGKDVEVIAVEYNQEIANVYQEWYPEDKVIVADAGEYLAKHYEEFDFIWASPSCVTHSAIRFMASKSKTNRKYDAKMPNMELYSFIVFLQKFFEGKWVVENVKPYYPPLIQPTGELGRHLIWSNFEFEEKDFQDSHIKHVKVTGKSVKYGISLDGIKLKHRKDQIIRNCVNPEISKFLLEQAFNEQSHKSHTLASPTFPTEKAINKDLTATQQVATPKCPSDTSLNPDIKQNFELRLQR
jgi:DNA (cytosine-5)-methyltransferase 1